MMSAEAEVAADIEMIKQASILHLASSQNSTNKPAGVIIRTKGFVAKVSP